VSEFAVGELVWMPRPPQEYLRHRIGTVIEMRPEATEVLRVDFGLVVMQGPGGTAVAPHVIHEAHWIHFERVSPPVANRRGGR
jgi:hypothetical protein